jgi:(4-(4-[2-(gamma-L-glutamylamino)ethyl]phenoxymethyl)furan-2-yl)methanamine synthase
VTPPTLPAAECVALDVGGANLKAADGRGWCHAGRFELWRRRGELVTAIADLLAAGPSAGCVVATMTGEIADCFESRAEGVQSIVEAVVAAAAGRPVGIYLVDGSIVDPALAIARPLEAAASNWHATARLAASVAGPGEAVLVDVGSTTSDLVRIVDGEPRPRGLCDVARMATGELVYTGVERTPVAAVAAAVPWRGRLQPLSSERYAESRDVWMLLGGLAPDPADSSTADGRPATLDGARRRLARMLLADPEELPMAEAIVAAEAVAAAQARQLAEALVAVSPPATVILAGHGGCLARRAIRQLGWDCRLVDLAEVVGSAAARVAPAEALARIALGTLR